MNIDMKSTINQLRVLEHQFNHPQKSKEGVENSYLCLCGVEEIAKELLRFVENHKSTYHKLMIDKFMKREEKYNGTGPIVSFTDGKPNRRRPGGN